MPDNPRSLHVALLRNGLQPLESFLIKAIQLYEMIVVRHGLMLVGASYGMKTATYRTLAAALTGGVAAGMHGCQVDSSAHVCSTVYPMPCIVASPLKAEPGVVLH